MIQRRSLLGRAVRRSRRASEEPPRRSCDRVLRVAAASDRIRDVFPLAAIAMRTTTRSNVLSLSRSRCWVRHHRCRRPRSHRRSGHRRRRLHRLCHCRRCRSRWRHACRLPHSDPHARPNSDPHARRPRWVGFRIRAVYRVSCPYVFTHLTSFSSRKCCPLQASPLRRAGTPFASAASKPMGSLLEGVISFYVNRKLKELLAD